jgi:transposase InsO family protein
VVSPSARRRAAQYLVEGKKCSVNAACTALSLAKSTYYRQGSTRVGAVRLERRIKALSLKNPRYGYRLITELLRREGWQVNRKRVQRIRRQKDLQVVAKACKTKRPRPQQAERARATKPNEVWSYDFVHDRLENGIGLKLLTVLDEFTRESLGILVERSITAAGVVDFLEVLMLKRGVPRNVRSDNGPEFVAEAVKRWAGIAGITMNYIAPGSPWENGHVESFHDKFRDGCLNREVFGNLLEAKVLIEDWRRQYNEQRPHSSLGYKTPQEFGRQFNSKLRVATRPSALS